MPQKQQQLLRQPGRRAQSLPVNALRLAYHREQYALCFRARILVHLVRHLSAAG